MHSFTASHILESFFKTTFSGIFQPVGKTFLPSRASSISHPLNPSSTLADTTCRARGSFM